MKIYKPAVAGTLESSDIMIQIEPAIEGSGIQIELHSSVAALYGKQIRKSIEDTLAHLEINDIKLLANDRGALDCTICARVETAVRRAAKGES